MQENRYQEAILNFTKFGDQEDGKIYEAGRSNNT